jgi:hypothetical protein
MFSSRAGLVGRLETLRSRRPDMVSIVWPPRSGIPVAFVHEPGRKIEDVRLWASAFPPHGGFEPLSADSCVRYAEDVCQQQRNRSRNPVLERHGVEGMIVVPFPNAQHYDENNPWFADGRFSTWMQTLSRVIVGQDAHCFPIQLPRFDSRTPGYEFGIDRSTPGALVVKALIDTFHPAVALEPHDSVAFGGAYGFTNFPITPGFEQFLFSLSKTHRVPLHTGPLADCPWAPPWNGIGGPIYHSWSFDDQMTWAYNEVRANRMRRMPVDYLGLGDNMYGYLLRASEGRPFVHCSLDAPLFTPRYITDGDPKWLLRAPNLYPDDAEDAQTLFREQISELLDDEELERIRFETGRSDTALAKLLNPLLTGSLMPNATNGNPATPVSRAESYRLTDYSAANTTALITRLLVMWLEQNGQAKLVDEIRSTVDNRAGTTAVFGGIRNLTHAQVEQTGRWQRSAMSSYVEVVLRHVDLEPQRRGNSGLQGFFDSYDRDMRTRMQAHEAAGRNRRCRQAKRIVWPELVLPAPEQRRTEPAPLNRSSDTVLDFPELRRLYDSTRHHKLPGALKGHTLSTNKPPEYCKAPSLMDLLVHECDLMLAICIYKLNPLFAARAGLPPKATFREDLSPADRIQLALTFAHCAHLLELNKVSSEYVGKELEEAILNIAELIENPGRDHFSASYS